MSTHPPLSNIFSAICLEFIFRQHLGENVSVAVIFDRDYRTDSEVEEDILKLNAFSDYAHVLQMKEIENYLLNPKVLHNAIKNMIKIKKNNNSDNFIFDTDITELLLTLTDSIRSDIFGQYQNRQFPMAKRKDAKIDGATITSKLLNDFDQLWSDPDQRLGLVPGKKILSKLNSHLQDTYRISLSSRNIFDSMTIEDIPLEITNLIKSLHKFGMNQIVLKP